MKARFMLDLSILQMISNHLWRSSRRLARSPHELTGRGCSHRYATTRKIAGGGRKVARETWEFRERASEDGVGATAAPWRVRRTHSLIVKRTLSCSRRDR